MGVLKLLLKIMGKLWVAVIIIIWCYKFLSIFVELAIYLSNILNFFYFSVLACHRKINVLMILRAQVQSLKDENERLKGQIKRLEKKQEACRCVVSPHCLSTFIKTDDDVNFYSEIPNIETFVRLQEFIAPFVICTSFVERNKTYVNKNQLKVQIIDTRYFWSST